MKLVSEAEQCNKSVKQTNILSQLSESETSGYITGVYYILSTVSFVNSIFASMLPSTLNAVKYERALLGRLNNTVYRMLCIACCVSHAVYRMPCIACRVSHVVYRMPCIAWCVSHAVYRMPCIACRVSHDVYRMMCVACRVSHAVVPFQIILYYKFSICV